MEAHGTEEVVYSVEKILDFQHYKYKVFNAHVFLQNILYYLTAHKALTPNDLCQSGQPKFAHLCVNLMSSSVKFTQF